tara:strand:- start:178 stop:516 length:339 start_codon:yes stop_codon:yes gene_type:complete
MCLPLYSLIIAHTNDFIQPDEIVATASSISILLGIGLVFGPISVAFFMNIFGADGFFVHLFIVHLALGIFGLYRLAKRSKPTDIESQYSPLSHTITASGMELNPKVDTDLDK